MRLKGTDVVIDTTEPLTATHAEAGAATANGKAGRAIAWVVAVSSSTTTTTSLLKSDKVFQAQHARAAARPFDVGSAKDLGLLLVWPATVVFMGERILSHECGTRTRREKAPGIQVSVRHTTQESVRHSLNIRTIQSVGSAASRTKTQARTAAFTTAFTTAFTAAAVRTNRAPAFSTTTTTTWRAILSLGCLEQRGLDEESPLLSYLLLPLQRTLFG